MKLSKRHLKTLREAPKEAELVSHQLLIRANLVRKVAAGIYEFMPLGYRSLRKVENIVREELDRIGDQEILMPGPRIRPNCGRNPADGMHTDRNCGESRTETEETSALDRRMRRP